MAKEFLNSKEIKEINKRLEEQHRCNFGKDYFFVRTGKDKVYIINKDVGEIDLDRLRVDIFGLYVISDTKSGLRLSMEGTQLIGKEASKNVIELNDKETNKWMLGEDVEFSEEQIDEQINEEDDKNNFFIVKHNHDFLGSGKLKENILLNFVPRERRVGAII